MSNSNNSNDDGLAEYKIMTYNIQWEAMLNNKKEHNNKNKNIINIIKKALDSDVDFIGLQEASCIYDGPSIETVEYNKCDNFLKTELTLEPYNTYKILEGNNTYGRNGVEGNAIICKNNFDVKLQLVSSLLNNRKGTDAVPIYRTSNRPYMILYGTYNNKHSKNGEECCIINIHNSHILEGEYQDLNAGHLFQKIIEFDLDTSPDRDKIVSIRSLNTRKNINIGVNKDNKLLYNLKKGHINVINELKHKLSNPYLYPKFRVFIMGDFNVLSEKFHSFPEIILFKTKIYRILIDKPTFIDTKRQRTYGTIDHLFTNKISATNKTSFELDDELYTLGKKDCSDHFPLYVTLKLYTNYGYDFDGVIHKNLSNQGIYTNIRDSKKISNEDVLDRYLDTSLFNLTIDDMKNATKYNIPIYIVSENNALEPYKKKIIEFFSKKNITINEFLITNNESKVNTIKENNITRFIDDSCKNIVDIYKEKQQNYDTFKLEELVWAYPEKEQYWQIDFIKENNNIRKLKLFKYDCTVPENKFNSETTNEGLNIFKIAEYNDTKSNIFYNLNFYNKIKKLVKKSLNTNDIEIIDESFESKQKKALSNLQKSLNKNKYSSTPSTPSSSRTSSTPSSSRTSSTPSSSRYGSYSSYGSRPHRDNRYGKYNSRYGSSSRDRYGKYNSRYGRSSRDRYGKIIADMEVRPENEIVNIIVNMEGRPETEMVNIIVNMEGRPETEIVNIIVNMEGRPETEIVVHHATEIEIKIKNIKHQIIALKIQKK